MTLSLGWFVGGYAVVVFLVAATLHELGTFGDDDDAAFGRIACSVFWAPVAAFWIVIGTIFVLWMAARQIVRLPLRTARFIASHRQRKADVLREVERMLR